jgi:TolB protein
VPRSDAIGTSQDREDELTLGRAFAATFAALSFMLVGLAAACGSGDSTESGQLIVYEAQSGGATNVYTIDPVSGKTTQLTHGNTFDGNPAWLPDHKHIVFSSRHDGQAKADLYVMDADGSHARRLTDTPDGAEWSAKISPDGNRMTYVRDAPDGTWSLWLANADGTSQRQVAGPFAFAEFPVWAPDPNEIYFAAIAQGSPGEPAPELHIYSVDLTTNAVQTRIDTGGTDACPHFSHDGKRLTYAASRSGGEYATGNNLDLFAHDMSSDDTTGADDVPLTNDPARDDYGNPSPDDAQMIFISDRDGNAELYVMDRDGSNQRRLTNTPDLRENVPDW